MATELGKAYVQIVPSLKGMQGTITKELGGEGEAAGKAVGGELMGAIKGVIIAAGIGKIISEALNAGGALQQSLGGIDTLYTSAEGGKEAVKILKDYSAAAVEAGISANTYAEQAVSFGAALKSSFDGDMVKAAEAANTAILDMADNSAKMGTDISAIQTAYQGFAKQNYTMLDNLKLGYGGTKKEMERLLADAEKLSGVEYNIDNLGDVYAAIHVIQEDLNLTGVAAEEAGTTFSGSLNAMKAAAENLLANLALGENITPHLEALGKTVSNFVFLNLLPMLGNIVKALPKLVADAIPLIIDAAYSLLEQAGEVFTNSDELLDKVLDKLSEKAPDFFNKGSELFLNLVNGIVSALPGMINTATSILDEFGTAVSENLPGIFKKGSEIQMNLVNGILENFPELEQAAGDLIIKFLEIILSNLPLILEKGSEMLMNLLDGIVENLPEIVSSTNELVKKFIDTIYEHLPDIVQQGIRMLSKLVNGIISALPELIAAVLSLIVNFLGAIVSNLPQILKTGITIVLELVSGILSADFHILAAILELIGIAIDNFMQTDWLSLGVNLVKGIYEGITSMAGWLVDKIKEFAGGILKSFKDAFGIASPSKLMAKEIGHWIPPGIAEGIKGNADAVNDAVDSLMNFETIGGEVSMSLKKTVKNDKSLSFNSEKERQGFNQTLIVNSPTELNPSEVARQTRNANRELMLNLGVV
nr:MAG TPA: tail tape measure protein [Caudoviricetes sp.]